MADARPDVVVLQGVRLSFPKIWKAEKFNDEAKVAKFSASFLIDPDTALGAANIKKIKAALKLIKTATWKEKADKIYDNIDQKRLAVAEPGTLTNEEGEEYGGYEGMWSVKASNAKRPQILDRDKTPIAADDEAAAKLFGGCYVDAVVSFFAITDKDKGGNGLFASLEIIRYRKTGDPFGAAPMDADDLLDELDDDEDADDLI